MLLSIVSTLYQSSPHIGEFYTRASQAAQKLVGDEYEIIFINDGSPDDSLTVALQLTAQDSHVIVVDLSRNFGHHKAMMAGLEHAQGEKIFLIDSDLEEEPEWLMEFNQLLETESSDVVYGVQARRKGGFFERFSGDFFYSLLIKITGMDIPANMVTARLMSKCYVDALLLHTETEVFLAGLFHIAGFKQMPYVVNKHSTSETTYTLRKKLTMLVNAITSFSASPLIAIFYFGTLISILSGGYSTYLVFRWLAFSNSVSGWTSVMVSIWLLGGLITCFIGIVGIYLSKIFAEVKHRPNTIVRRVYAKHSLQAILDE